LCVLFIEWYIACVVWFYYGSPFIGTNGFVQDLNPWIFPEIMVISGVGIIILILCYSSQCESTTYSRQVAQWGASIFAGAGIGSKLILTIVGGIFLIRHVQFNGWNTLSYLGLTLILAPIGVMIWTGLILFFVRNSSQSEQITKVVETNTIKN